MKRHQTDHVTSPSHRDWGSVHGPATSRRRLGRRLGAFLLLLPLVVGVVGAPASPTGVRGDELSDAKARQAAIKKDIADQKSQVDQLNLAQDQLAADIKSTQGVLRGINADLVTVRANINTMEGRITVIEGQYNALVTKLHDLDAELTLIMAKEAAKKADLAERRTLLAQRLRSAYDTDRTSPLETFLSGGSFADLLSEMSYYIDVGEQDKALAEEIGRDQETLAAMHQATEDTLASTNVLRQATAAQKRALDASLADLNAAKAALKKLEQRTATALASQKRAFAAVLKNKAAAQKALAKAAAAQTKLQGEIQALIRQQMQGGNIPSEYNGTLTWPMAGDVTQNFGCTGFTWEPPKGSCSHFHNGIDIVAPYGTEVKASGDGTVVYIGWNYADGADPAWIVILAHSEGLQTWYAHMQPRYPGGIRAGSVVQAGQVIGYEGSTGHSTGAHLHWAVMFHGDFANPRLFL